MKITPLKRETPLKASKTPLKRTKLRLAGHSTASELKRDVQALLREIVIHRDGGCFLRNYQDKIVPSYRGCDSVLQAEHLHSRSNANSFSDSRLVVCCCRRHHIFYKPQYSDEYYKFAKDFIGEERRKLLERVQEDRTPHKVDLKLEKLSLEQELKNLLK